MARREMMKCKDMLVDLSYQREINATKVNQIKRYYDPKQVRPVILSERSDGYYVVDGNHTRTALMEVKGKDALCECYIYTGLTQADEAKLFYTLNTNARKPTYNNLLKSRYAMNDPKAVRYIDILNISGLPWTWSDKKTKKYSAHRAGMKLLDRYGKQVFLESASLLSTIDEAKKISAGYLGGICLIIATYTDLDANRLMEMIRKTPSENIEKAAASYRSLNHVETVQNNIAYALAFVDLYNYNRKRDKYKLPREALFMRKEA